MPLDTERLLAQARQLTGLEDFGDPDFRVGLDVLAASMDEADFDDFGTMASEGTVLGLLCNRLAVEAWYGANPQIADERIERPIFTIGLSRTGTTALSHLLSADPGNRSLLNWEGSQPVPPPSPETYRTDPRFLKAMEDPFGALGERNPEFRTAHHDPPDMPVECLVVMAQHFVSLSLPTMMFLPSYQRWVIDADHAGAYAWHERVLKLLQSGGVRGRWQLKSPHHPLALDDLIARYPDARFIVTHRDPAVVVASTISLVRILQSTFTGVDHLDSIRPLFTDMLVTMCERTMAARDRYGDDRFVDVAYRDLVTDPVGAVRRLYADLGEELTPEAEAAMAAHTQEHRQNRFGRHSYTFEGLGLSRGAINERFATYQERFGQYYDHEG
jgi:hypothetical protein